MGEGGRRVKGSYANFNILINLHRLKTTAERTQPHDVKKKMLKTFATYATFATLAATNKTNS